jgi:hypothetical protein
LATLGAFATLTTAFAPALATVSTALTSLARSALLADFTAFGIQLSLGFARAVDALAFRLVLTACG